MRRILLLCSLAALVQLVGCTREIRWQEEVPLNTGEVIWVERKHTFERRGSPGNPLEPSWSPQERAYTFEWGGRKYRYKDDTLAPLMLAIVRGSPVFVHWVVDCERPGYAEHRWDGDRWVLQEEVSPELIGRTWNLMGYYSADGLPDRVTSEIRRRKDTSLRGPRLAMQLRPEKIALNCRKG